MLLWWPGAISGQALEGCGVCFQLLPEVAGLRWQASLGWELFRTLQLKEERVPGVPCERTV